MSPLKKRKAHDDGGSMKKSVILFSGGLDSTTCLAYAKNQGFDCYPLSFNYGQRHSTELNAAQKIAQSLGISTHKIIEFPPHVFGPSALTQSNIPVPDFDETKAEEIPTTYVPARNTIFLAFALGYAESLDADECSSDQCLERHYGYDRHEDYTGDCAGRTKSKNAGRLS